MDDLRHAGREPRAQRRVDAGLRLLAVAVDRGDELAPAGRQRREARRRQQLVAQPLVRPRLPARPQQHVDARNPELLAAAQQLVEHHLAEEARRAGQ